MNLVFFASKTHLKKPIRMWAFLVSLPWCTIEFTTVHRIDVNLKSRADRVFNASSRKTKVRYGKVNMAHISVIAPIPDGGLEGVMRDLAQFIPPQSMVYEIKGVPPNRRANTDHGSVALSV